MLLVCISFERRPPGLRFCMEIYTRELPKRLDFLPFFVYNYHGCEDGTF